MAGKNDNKDDIKNKNNNNNNYNNSNNPNNNVPLKKSPINHVGRDIIIFASTNSTQRVPHNPLYPADVLTACLTTPLRVALRHCVARSKVLDLTAAEVDALPGQSGDRSVITIAYNNPIIITL